MRAVDDHAYGVHLCYSGTAKIRNTFFVSFVRPVTAVTESFLEKG